MIKNPGFILRCGSHPVLYWSTAGDWRASRSSAQVFTTLEDLEEVCVNLTLEGPDQVEVELF